MKNKRFIAGLTAAVLTETMLAAAMPAVSAESIKSTVQRVTLSEWDSSKVVSLYGQGTPSADFEKLGNFKLKAKISNIEVHTQDDNVRYETTTDTLDVALYYEPEDAWDSYTKKADSEGGGNYSLYGNAQYIVLESNYADNNIYESGVRVSAGEGFSWDNIDEISFDVEYEFVKEEAPAKPQPDPSGKYRYPLSIYTGDQPYSADGANGFLSSAYFNNVGDNSELIFDVTYSTFDTDDDRYIEPYYTGMGENALEINTNAYEYDGKIYPDGTYAGEERTVQFTVKPASVQAMLEAFSKTDDGGFMFKSNGVLIKNVTISERRNAGGVQYTVYSDHAVVESYVGDEKKVTVLSEVDGRPVTEIKKNAFSNNENIEEVILPDSINTIGSSAFEYCSELKKINIPKNVTAIPNGCFYGCGSLEEVTLPDGLKEIYAAAFLDCYSLADIDFPDTVELIEGNALDGTKWYEDAKKKNEMVTAGCVLLYGRNVSGDVVVPDNIKNIHGYAFLENENITSVTFPAGVQVIEEDAFRGCTKLTSVTIPASVRTIESYAFDSCTNLTSVTFAEGTEEIGDHAFINTGLKNVSIPKSVKEIGNDTFGYDNGWNKVDDFIISCYSGSEGYRYAKEHNFEIDLLDAKSIDGLKYILNNRGEAVITGYVGKSTTVVIPEEIDGAKVTDINAGSFKRSSVKELTIPGTVRHISSHCFENCKTLEKVTLQEGVEYIENEAFRNCTSLKEVSLPDSLYGVYDEAFVDCNALESVTVPKGAGLYSRVFGYHTEKDEDGYDSYVKNEKFKMFVSYNSDAMGYAQENGFEYEAVDLYTDETGLQYIVEKDYDDESYAKIVEYTGKGDKLVIPETLGGYPVKKMRSAMFKESKLKEISFPGTLRTIPSECMLNSTLLEKVTLNDGIENIEEEAFYGCTALKSIELPDSINNVNYYSFMNCDSIKSVKIPRNAYLYDSCFGYHTKEDGDGHTDIVKNDGFKMYVYYGTRGMSYAKDRGFDYEIVDLKTDESGVQYITVSSDEDYAMAVGYTGKEDKVVIPESLGGYPVKKVSKDGFRELKIKELTLPGTLYEIPNSFMEGNTTLEKLVVSNGVREIDYSAFKGCTSLKKVELPDSLYDVYDYAFLGCTSLESVSIPKGTYCDDFSFGYNIIKDDEGYDGYVLNDKFKMYVFYGSSAQTYARSNGIAYELLGAKKYGDFICVETEDGTVIAEYKGKDKDITIPGEIEGSAVTAVGSYAFENNTTVTSVNFSENIRSIGRNAFSGCTSLKDIQLPETLREIEDYAFLDCPSMTEVTVGEDVSLDYGSLGFRTVSDSNGYKQEEKRDDFTIYCYYGSNAARYAKNNEIKYVLVDVKDDGDYKYRLYEGSFYDNDEYEYKNIKGVQLLEYLGDSKDVTIPEKIDGYEVISLHSDLFKDKPVENVVIPNTVRETGYGIFRGMESLKSVVLPSSMSSVGEFSNCKNLEKVTISSGTRSINANAFSGCTKLAEIEIPETVTFIGSNAFYGTKWLETQRSKTPMVIVNNILVDGRTVKGKAEIPEGTKYIAGSAFADNTELTDVTFPESLYSVEDYAFYGCTSLKEVTIPKTISDIGYDAFGFMLVEDDSHFSDDYRYGIKMHCYYSTEGHYYAKNNDLDFDLLDVESTEDFIYNVRDDDTIKLLEYISTDGEVIMPEQIKGKPVTEINDRIFYDKKGYLKTLDVQCRIDTIPAYFVSDALNLKSVKLPESVTCIDTNAFFNCPELETLNIPEGVTDFGADPFGGTKWLDNMRAKDPLVVLNGVLIDGYKTKGVVTIPKGVKTINYDAFRENTALTGVSFPETVGKIYNEAFFGCTNLKEVTIPETVTFIGTRAFGYYYNENEKILKTDGFKIKCYYQSRGMSYAVDNEFDYEILDMKENDEFEYVEENDGTVTIMGYKGKSADVVIPPELDGKRVCMIGDNTFKGNKDITSIVIPSSIEYLGRNSFEGCTKLASVTISNGVEGIGSAAFKDCTALKEVILSEDITSLNDETFMGCTSLEKIDISRVYEIGQRVFSGCSALKDITFCEQYYNIEAQAFEGTAWLTAQRKLSPYVMINDMLLDATTVKGEAKIPDGVRVVCNGAFRDNKDITSVVFPESLKYINDFAFYGCTGLKEVTIPSTVENINYRALGYDEDGRIKDFKMFVYINTAGEDYARNYGINFEYLDALKYGDFYYTQDESGITIARYSGGASVVTVPDKIKDKPVVALDKNAFSDADTITKITLPETVTSIGDNCFYNCDSLKTLEIPAAVTYIGREAFESCRSLTSITIPDNVEEIYPETFTGCNSLTEVNLPKELRKIDTHAFSHCTSLAKVEIPSSVARIGYKAFYDTAMTDVTIPKSVTYIDSYAFGYIADRYDDEEKAEGFTVSGYKGTAAQTYAENNGFKFISLGEPVFVKGDADGNDVVNAKDLAIMQMVINKEIDDYEVLGELDLNGDGKVNAKDLAIMQMVINKEMELK